MYRIKEIAKAKGIQQKEIAERIGVEPNTISRINNGESTTVERLQQIAEVLDVSVKDLFEGNSPVIHLIINDKPHTFHSMSELKEFIALEG